MKKYILIAASVLLIGGVTIFAVPKSREVKTEATPVKKEIAELKRSTANELLSIGFSQSSTIVSARLSEEKSLWLKRGYNYLTKEDVDLTMQENNWVIAPANKYIGVIPEDAALRIKDNYNRLANDEFNYECIVNDGRSFTKQEVEALPEPHKSWAAGFAKIKYKDVFVVAPLEKFDQSEMVLVDRELKAKNPDPIALVKTEYGYIELARW